MDDSFVLTISALDSPTHCIDTYEKIKGFTRTLTQNLYTQSDPSQKINFLASEIGNIDKFYNLRILKKLGEGAFSEVFRAVNETDKEEFAIRLTKINSPRYTIERAKREILIYNQLKLINNKHIYRIFKSKIISSEEEQYLQTITELGVCSLDVIVRNRIEEKAYWSEAELLRISQDLITALALAQSYGISHRDISLNNIILSRNLKDFKLIDFAEAHHFAIDLGSQNLVGKVRYFAPEVLDLLAKWRLNGSCKGGLDYDLEKADVFALGIVFLSMATLEFINGTEMKDVVKGLMKVQKRYPRLYLLFSEMLHEDSTARKRFLNLKLMFLDWEKEIFGVVLNELDFIEDKADVLKGEKEEVDGLIMEADYHKKNCLYIKAIEIYLKLYKIEMLNKKAKWVKQKQECFGGVIVEHIYLPEVLNEL